MKKISIIIAVYNVEKYLARCLQSVIRQKGDDIEIIIVDDGSSDNSLKICKTYQKKDNRIKIVHKKNGGLSSARNYGFIKSTGEYIWHIDGDDYIGENSVDVIKKYINKYDILCFSFYNVVNDKITKARDPRFYFNEEEKYILSYSFAWNKVFKRNLFDKDSFPENNHYNDIGIISSLISKTKKIKFIDDYLYYYVHRSSSITYTRKFHLEEYLICMERVYNALYKEYPEAAMAYYINHLLLYGYASAVKTGKKFNYRELNTILKTKFPKYYKNKYYNVNLSMKIYTRLIYYNMHFLVKMITYFKLKIFNKLLHK